MQQRALFALILAVACRGPAPAAGHVVRSDDSLRVPAGFKVAVYADSLSQELANLAREYAKEQGYSFVGPVRVRFEPAGDLAQGMFRIRSGVIRGSKDRSASRSAAIRCTSQKNAV